MTEAELDIIERRAAKATKGPWKSRVNNQRPYRHVEFDKDMYDTSPLKSGDADFIAHARADVPALLEEVRRLRRVKRSASA